MQAVIGRDGIKEDETFLTHVGIGHTRWATHGPPCQKNRYALVGCSVLVRQR